MSKLCIGTFGHLLRLCKRNNISDPMLIGTMTRIVDPDCAYINPDNKTAVSKLLACRGNFPLSAGDKEKRQPGEAISNVVFRAQRAQRNEVLIGFNHDVLPLLDPDKIERLALALLKLIENDDTIAQKGVSFEKHLGKTKDTLLSQDAFFMDELLSGLFLFVTAEGIDNREGKDTLPILTPQYIDDLTNDQNIKVYPSVSSLQNTAEESATAETDRDADNSDDPDYFLDNNLDAFRTYLRNAKEKYMLVKTLLYSNEPKAFYDFYVCNDIHTKTRKTGRFSTTTEVKTIKDASIQQLFDISRFIILSGTGGLGKSMMMRHLLLDSINSFHKSGIIPIFIPIKDFDEDVESLFTYIYSKIGPLSAKITPTLLETLLDRGRVLLLLDGLDEIKSEQSRKFEYELELFTDRYSKNHFVISSRPDSGNFVSFSRFTIFELNVFTRSQALDLVDKLEFRTDEPAIKEKFREALDTKLYTSHLAFTANPLLLTIMLMTFEQYAEVPSKMHIFYREAFSVLSAKHDASKGAYQRTLRTGLTSHRLEEYFAEFCFRSYFLEKFELTEDEFSRIYADLKEPKKLSTENASAADFLTDLCSNLCVMYSDAGKYHFIHRSFQEYFCALFLSKQKDRMLESIGNHFENRRTRMFSDKTFEMLYDMIPDKIEEYIFIPFLEELYGKCDQLNGYATFLEIMYPQIRYETGDTNEWIFNTASSFLFSFIREIAGLYRPDCDNFPSVSSLIDAEYVSVYDDETGDDIIITKDEVDWEYELEYGKPDTVGWVYEFKPSILWDNPEAYQELIERLENSECDFKKEYVGIRNYLTQLKEKQNPVGDTLLDIL